MFYFRYNLGMVLESLGEVEAASDCMATALEVETTNPILPILSIPVTFEWFGFLAELRYDEIKVYFFSIRSYFRGHSLAFPSIVPGHVVLLYKLIVKRKKKEIL